MTRLLFLLALPLCAQDVFEHGAKVFRMTCAQGYCHGSGGTQGRAPKLIGRNFDSAYILKTVQDGIPNTGMPAFKERLPAQELNAVTAYVVKISGGDTSKLAAASSAPVMREMPADAKPGKELFSDAIRGVNRCSTCHAMEGIGTAVGPNLAAAGYDLDAIRNGKPASIRQAATKSGDRFPALVVGTKEKTIQVFDLTVAPPVLRTFSKDDLTFSGASAWRHANAVSNYTDGDFTAIAAYLKWVAER